MLYVSLRNDVDVLIFFWYLKFSEEIMGELRGTFYS